MSLSIKRIFFSENIFLSKAWKINFWLKDQWDFFLHRYFYFWLFFFLMIKFSSPFFFGSTWWKEIFDLWRGFFDNENALNHLFGTLIVRCNDDGWLSIFFGYLEASWAFLSVRWNGKIFPQISTTKKSQKFPIHINIFPQNPIKQIITQMENAIDTISFHLPKITSIITRREKMESNNDRKLSFRCQTYSFHFHFGVKNVKNNKWKVFRRKTKKKSIIYELEIPCWKYRKVYNARKWKRSQIDYNFLLSNLFVTVWDGFLCGGLGGSLVKFFLIKKRYFLAYFVEYAIVRTLVPKLVSRRWKLDQVLYTFRGWNLFEFCTLFRGETGSNFVYFLGVKLDQVLYTFWRWNLFEFCTLLRGGN
jgi:hypothetical protein